MGDQRGPISGQLVLGRGRQRLMLELKGTITAQEREQFIGQVRDLAKKNGLTLRRFETQQLMSDDEGSLLKDLDKEEN